MCAHAVIARAIVPCVARHDRADGGALLLHVDELLAREIALVHALRHSQVVEERQEIERISERDRPFQDG